MSGTDKRKLQPGAEDRIAAAGTRNWPVVVTVNRTARAFGVITTHYFIDGALATFCGVGDGIAYEDFTTPDGQRHDGIATGMLKITQAFHIRLAA